MSKVNAPRPRLVATPPRGTEQLPLEISGLHLAYTPAQITSVAPFKGQAENLKDWPEIGMSQNGLIWAGFDLAFAVDTDVSHLSNEAALTDQSSALCQLCISGPDISHVMQRLCPLDISALEDGATARSLLGHMNAIYWRISQEELRVFVFRSMAQTAIHELIHAMQRREALLA